MKRGFLLVAGGVIAGLTIATLLPQGGSVSAQGSSVKCDYTYIDDAGEPNLGKRGEIKYNEAWQGVLSSGWLLKTASTVGSTGVYIFEKCR